MTSFARAERQRLVDTARETGPDAPTLCGEWTVEQLVEHLVVREGSPAAAGIVIGPLEPVTEAAMRRAGRHGFEPLLERFAHPPIWSPVRIEAVDKLLNTVEFLVHHEDIRRAAPGWTPRDLSDRDQDTIWRALAMPGKGLVRPAGVPVTIAWGDQTHVLRGGDDPAVVTGPPVELAMFLFGRAEHRGLDFSGPESAIAALKGAKLGA